jgi:hypothetical protein
MTDFTQLTSQIVTLLTMAAPYLTAAATGMATTIGQKVGVEVVEKAKGLVAQLRARFQGDQNEKAAQTLDLFLDDADTFRLALSKLLQQALTQNPAWAQELQQLLADGPTQTIIANNSSIVREITMQLTGEGSQKIDADHQSRVEKVKMTINRG